MENAQNKKIYNIVINLYFKIQNYLLVFLLFFLTLKFFFLDDSIDTNIGHKFNFFINNIILISVLLMSVVIYFFLNKEKSQKKYFITHFSFLLSLFIINLTLEIKMISNLPLDRISHFKKYGVTWDTRSQNDFISYLKKEMKKENIHKAAQPTGFIIGNINNKIKFNNTIVPFSNISNSIIVHCNESGIWNTHKTDKFGFNNPKNITKKNKKNNLMLIGNSFTEGYCVPNENDIGNQLRLLNYNVLNLGMSGGGALFSNAKFREYKNAYNFKTNFVLYMYYSGDIIDTKREYEHPFYQKYISNINFSQGLKNRQNEIDNFWKDFFLLTSDPKFIKKYPSLKKYGQYYVTNNKKIHYQYHLKKIFLLTNIRSFVHDILIKKVSKQINIENNKQLNIFKTSIKNFHDEINKFNNKTKFIFVYLPSYDEIASNSPSLRNEILKLIEELNIDIINPYEEFLKIDTKILFDADITGHYNSKGYNVLSKIIDQHLVNKYDN
ncbi:hypothetical protein OAJ64_01215 [Pelagibacteraceae bacterium]|nr:hypothetical protein [Pelagibacteraceae bacterium]